MFRSRTSPAVSRRLALVAASTLCAAAAHAQFRASIQGTVTDPQGAAIPNATLTLTDLENNRVLNATSNDSGTFNFNALAPDRYKLTTDAPGFRQSVIENFTINPEQSNAVNVQLNVADTQSSVSVTADQAPVLDTETASISGNVDSNQIQHLPSAGRDVFQLVQLAPGVFGDGAQGTGGGQNLPGSQGPGAPSRGGGIFSTENGPQANANGGQYENNSIQIDGISTVSAVWGGTSIITPNEDSVGSVKVLSNGYDAENGRFAGAQIQVTSKTGTNQFHGSAFFRASRPGLNAYQRYNGASTYNPGTAAQRGLQRDTTRSNQIGGSIGGPIWRDHIFAFFAYETQRDNSVATGSSWYETAAFRAAAPTGSIASTYLNFPGAAVSSNAISTQTCAQAGFVEGVNCRTVSGGLDLGSPLKTALKTQDLSWQSSTNPGVGGGLDGVADIALYNTTNPTNQVGTQYNGRLDADVTKNDHLAFAIYYVPLSRTNYQGSTRAYNLFNHNQINEAYSVIYNHVFSPTFLNEARANSAGWRWNEITSNPQEPFGLPTSTVDVIGSNNIQIGNFGAPGPSNLNQHTYTYKDVATKVLGNHNIKFGGELTRLYYLNNPTYNARPYYNFYNIWDFLNDAPHAEGGSFNPSTGTPFVNRQDNRENLWGGFIQDDWKARPNLTLNMGLRYSYFSPLYSKQNNIGVVQLGQGAQTFTGINIRQGGDLTQSQKGNFGPQFGFAYSPTRFNNKMVVRGGYGLNFNQTEIAITGNVGSNPPYVLNAAFNSANPTAINPKIVYNVASDPRSLFGYPANPNATGGFNSAGLPTAGGTFVTAFQDRQPTVYTQHYSLDTQIELPYRLVASVGYQGSVGRHIIVQSFPYIRGVAFGQALNPLISNMNMFTNTGTSNNNSLLIGLKKTMSHGLMFDAEYQYSKSMDTGSGPYYSDPYPYRPDLAYGRSDFNFGKAFKLYGLWQPTFFKGNSLLSKIADGWSVSGIWNIHTGFPFTANYQTNGSLYYATSGQSTLRPAAYNGGGGHVGSNDAFKIGTGKGNLNFPQQAGVTTASPYFINPATGIPTGTGAYGLPSLPGVARNTFNGPGYSDVDATVAKAFGFPGFVGVREGAKLEVRADAFNLFNQTNLVPGSVVTNILSNNFGQATQGLSGRIVNLQARVSF